MPMHVGSLNLFDAARELPRRSWYEAGQGRTSRKRMHLAPVFTRKLALMPFDLANPVWIHDDDIDLDYHVRYMVLPKPGTIGQLEALAARLHSMPARPQPAALGVLRHRGPGRRPDRLLRQGAPRRASTARPASRWRQHVRPHARAARRQAAARSTRQHLPARRRRAARRGAAEPDPAGRARASSCCPRSSRTRVQRGAGGDRDAAQRDRGRSSRAQGRGAADALQARAGDAVQPLDHQPARVRRASRCRCPRSSRSARRSARRSTTSSCGSAAPRCARYLKEGRASCPTSRWSPACRSRCARKATRPPTTRSPAR